MELDLVRIECETVTDTPVQLADTLYNALRNFEERFKAACCQDIRETCSSCSHLACPYRMVFDQRLSSDPEIVRLHQKPSLPFSLYISMLDNNMSSCTVGLVVVGTAINYIALFYTSLVQMVETAVSAVLPRSTFAVHTYGLDSQDARYEVIPSESMVEGVTLISAQNILLNTVNSDTIRMNLKSPLRLLNNGSIAHEFDFGMFFRSQLRRCSSMCAYYGEGELDLDFTGLSDSAQNVAVLEDEIRYIQPPWSRRMNRAGLMGTVECTGLVEPMFSLLLLGSFFNAGKGATFGSGYYQIEPL